jgi:hypothetical protein
MSSCQRQTGAIDSVLYTPVPPSLGLLLQARTRSLATHLGSLGKYVLGLKTDKSPRSAKADGILAVKPCVRCQVRSYFRFFGAFFRGCECIYLGATLKLLMVNRAKNNNNRSPLSPLCPRSSHSDSRVVVLIIYPS